MTELDVKLVKVDNWGIFFLQRLKHFFNRTDYCDLTLQFQDNAQLKVHRLVLSGCTEYFEILERTCEMYEDCLVMPDDLQADVVVPIVNFMYTGQLEFRMDLLERLYQTSQILNMPILSKLLDAHRNQCNTVMTPALNHTSNKRSYSKSKEPSSRTKHTQAVASSSKRAYSKAFGSAIITPQEIKKTHSVHKTDPLSISSSINTNNGVSTPAQSPNMSQSNMSAVKKLSLRDPRPTRYELPEELDSDNIFENSFTNISYTSQPLMVHPETTKQYPRKKGNLYGEGSGIRRIGGGTTTMDIVECKPVLKKESIFDEHSISDMNEDLEMFSVRDQSDPNMSNQLFDQIIDQPTGPKVTIETKDTMQANNIDHAKIISEVLKKYPHLVKSNKNIKLKILNTPATPTTAAVNKAKPKKQRNSPTPYNQEKEMRPDTTDCTFETDVLDSKEAARLIALGAENVKGPWICLICGTPGKALHFTTYNKFRRHLVDVHNEKPISNMCEYCGLKSLKRNYLLHHLLTKHGVNPPPQYHFPKCNICSYVALTEGLLVRHKLTHSENRSFRCNVCFASYNTSNQLLAHIQTTGHKYCADRRTNLQCVYCLKVFLREGNLYAHLKTYHKQAAKSDGIIDDSDEENQKEEESAAATTIKYEPHNYDTEYDEVETQYQIRPDGNIELITKPINKQRPRTSTPSPAKQKILNSGFDAPSIKPVQKTKPPTKSVAPVQRRESNEEIVMIDNNEYIMRNNQLIPKKKGGNTYIIPEMVVAEPNEMLTPSTSMDFANIQNPIAEENLHEQKMVVKKATNINQPIQIVVSNEEEYKALMNANHSIIFDDGDTNKTLTVLSTPHNAAMNTLDLDNTQTNDMMIIQDNFPINVSEAMPGDNSNIVVVYSHAVDENNKQFQLISSQDIGAQFVQSPAVITQNFPTTTTVTPVMEDTQVMEPPMVQSWQNNDPVNPQPTEVAELHEMEITDHAEIIPLDQAEMATVQPTEIAPIEDTQIVSGTNTEMASMHHTELSAVEIAMENIHKELPEVNLATKVTEAIEEVVAENDTDNITNENVSLPLEASENDNIEAVKEAHNISLPSLEVDMSTESVTANTTDIIESVVVSPTNEPLQQDSLNTDTEDSIVSEQQQPDPPVEQNMENNTLEEHAEEAHTSEEHTGSVEQAIESVENEPAYVDDVQNMTEQIDTSMTAAPISEKIALPEETKEQIQNLTSEWSEDEYDTEEQVDENTEKQTGEVSGDTEDSANDKLPEQIAGSLPVEPPQAKISSLLNDWDENDSQEGNDSTNGTEDESVPTEATGYEELKESNMVILEKMEPKKDDKIKSLVSDWDDDEDENKH